MIGFSVGLSIHGFRLRNWCPLIYECLLKHNAYASFGNTDPQLSITRYVGQVPGSRPNQDN